MQVKYQCKCTRGAMVELDVPNRRPGQEIERWMDVVVVCVSADHRAMSPRCRETSIDTLYIPILKGNEIGTPVDEMPPPKLDS